MTRSQWEAYQRRQRRWALTVALFSWACIGLILIAATLVSLQLWSLFIQAVCS